MLSREEFFQKYRPLFLGWMTECYAIRKEPPSAFGMEIDRQFGRLNIVLNQMYADLTDIPRLPAPNGAPAPTQRVKQ